MVSLVYTSPSGSNTIALYKRIPKRIAETFDVSLVLQTMNKEFVEKIMHSDVVVITEANYHLDKNKFNPDQLVIDLWHSFPTKNIGYLNKNEPFVETIADIWRNIDILVSYSDLFNELMGKCLRVEEAKFRVLGAPRNDLLLRSNGKENLGSAVGLNLNAKNIIFYMPTWRYSARGATTEGHKSWDNIFGMGEFDNIRFDEFLARNNCVLVVKVHPAEEHKVLGKLRSSQNTKILTNRILAQSGFDLYEVLGSAHILITDYSSVYLDYLLLDRPIIFTPTDLEEYRRDRGLILEPYGNWSPGDMALTQPELEKAIIRALESPEFYSTRRQSVSTPVHRFQDAFASERVWDLIERLLEQR